MPAIDEEILRDLMHRATGDLHARPGVAAGVAAGRRRTVRRTRVLSVAAAGVAAGTAIGMVVATTGGPARHHPAQRIVLTSAQRTLRHLSVVAASSPRHARRYVVFSELSTGYKRTTIIDARNGDVWTYQSGRGVPARLPVYRHDSPTLAQLAAYPTGLRALRALLVRQARHDLTVGLRAEIAAIRQRHAKDARKVIATLRASVPKETRDDMVFSQTAYLLWNPLVEAPLRSALFKLLAATPGVVVNAHAKDSTGRPAVEISRFEKAASYTDAIFESPDASRVLETASIHPATKPHDGLPGEAAYTLSDTYLSITWISKLPAKSPYAK